MPRWPDEALTRWRVPYFVLSACASHFTPKQGISLHLTSYVQYRFLSHLWWTPDYLASMGRVAGGDIDKLAPAADWNGAACIYRLPRQVGLNIWYFMISYTFRDELCLLITRQR